jgi:hypothetical protein
MRGSPDGTVEPDLHCQETQDLAASASEQLSQFSREARLHRAKKRGGILHPIPGL